MGILRLSLSYEHILGVFTHADGSCVSIALIRLCDSVCVCVCVILSVCLSVCLSAR